MTGTAKASRSPDGRIPQRFAGVLMTGFAKRSREF